MSLQELQLLSHRPSFSTTTELCVIMFSTCILVHANGILIKYMCKMYIIIHEWWQGDRSVTFGVMATVTQESGEAGALQYLYPHNCFMLMSVHRGVNSIEKPRLLNPSPNSLLFFHLFLCTLLKSPSRSQCKNWCYIPMEKR